MISKQSEGGSLPKMEVSSLMSKKFFGQHCETTATGNLLYQCGIKLSEPMLFEIGRGTQIYFLESQRPKFAFYWGTN